MDYIFKRRKSFSLITFLLFLILSLFIMPYGDDYVCALPIIGSFGTLKLMPENIWRPLQEVYGYMLGFYPSLYPYLNHIIIVSAHFLSAYILYKIVLELNFDKKSAFWGAIFFIFSSNCFATVFSIDSLNQSLSLLFSSFAIYFCLKRKYLLYIISAILSVLSKESGFYSFVLPLAFLIIKERKRISDIIDITFYKRHLGIIICALVLTAGYFLILYWGSHFNTDSSVLSDPKSKIYYNNPLIGMVIHLGRIAAVDCPAFFLPKKMLLFGGVVFLLSVPLFILAILSSIKGIFKNNLFVFIILASTIFLALAHAVTGAETEMNSYPCIWIFSFLIVYVISKNKDIRKNLLNIVFSLFIISSILIIGHKYSLIMEIQGLRKEITASINAQTSKIPENVYVINYDNMSLGHDIYQNTSAYISASGGRYMRIFWKNWDINFSVDTYLNKADENELFIDGKNLFKITSDNELYNIVKDKISKYDAVWVFYPDNTVKVFSN